MWIVCARWDAAGQLSMEPPVQIRQSGKEGLESVKGFISYLETMWGQMPPDMHVQEIKLFLLSDVQRNHFFTYNSHQSRYIEVVQGAILLWSSHF
jgi:hypothetical protein